MVTGPAVVGVEKVESQRGEPLCSHELKGWWNGCSRTRLERVRHRTGSARRKRFLADRA